MFEFFRKQVPRFLLFCLFFVLFGVRGGGVLCWAGEMRQQAAESFRKTGNINAEKDIWDSRKYIGIDEVRPGMEAYCLTGYSGTEIEKFDLEVLSVVRNVTAGRDAILVQGTDERFIHTGPVAGCSGSPVYIDKRLAGALAFAWMFSKDPLYGVTPIEEMLRVGRGAEARFGAGESEVGTIPGRPGFVFDYSAPIDFAEIDRQVAAALSLKRSVLAGDIALGQQAVNNLFGGPLPCPLVTCGLPAEVCEQLSASVEPFGLIAVPGVGGGRTRRGDAVQSEDLKLEPGACLAVPLVTGDISVEAIGTVTEVLGDQVYGFGHGFLGYGHGVMDLPMATGQVHTVVSNVYRSFKFATAVEVVGALRADESAAVRGQIGAKARMIPLTIKVDRYNDAQRRVYNCQVADNQLLTPLVLRYVVTGAALMLGKLPPEHTVEYEATIGLEGTEAIAFKNVSTGQGLAEMLAEAVGSVAILMNNPYKRVDIKGIDFSVREVAKSVASRIWSVDLSDSVVEAGETLGVEVVVESFQASKKKYLCSLKIPDELAAGSYDLIVCGGYEYEKFLRKTVPYRFTAENVDSLIEAINGLLGISRNKLYLIVVLPHSGVALEKAELPDLPGTKALILRDAKRALRIQAYPHWLEESIETGTVIIDTKVMQIKVQGKGGVQK